MVVHLGDTTIHRALQSTPPTEVYGCNIKPHDTLAAQLKVEHGG